MVPDRDFKYFGLDVHWEGIERHRPRTPALYALSGHDAAAFHDERCAHMVTLAALDGKRTTRVRHGGAGEKNTDRREGWQCDEIQKEISDVTGFVNGTITSSLHPWRETVLGLVTKPHRKTLTGLLGGR